MASRIRPLVLAIVACSSLHACSHAASPPPRAPATTVAEVTHAPPPIVPTERLYDDLGTYHRAITTSSPEAQRYFDQGLRFYYSFNHDEAPRSFEQAAVFDPSCAMCAWGAALTLGPNINMPASAEAQSAAYASLRRALAHRDAATPDERALIDALARRYAETPPDTAEGRAALDQAYADAMREAMRSFPDDLDAATLFAEAMMDLHPWDLYTSDGTPKPGTEELVAALEGVLARMPDHPGANHFYVHAVEASAHPERALASAERLPGLVPGAGHIVHMPAHVYLRVGRYEDAAEANRRAIATDRTYLAQAPPPGAYGMYVAHNFQFLAAAAMMEGRSAEALTAARDMVATTPLEMFRQMPGFDGVLDYPILVLVRFGRWDAALDEAAPPEDLPFALAVHHFARAVARLGKGDVENARAEQASFEAAVLRVPADARQFTNSARAVLAVPHALLAGLIAEHERHRNEAPRLLREAVAAEDALVYDEPPDWLLPTRHYLGHALIVFRRYRDAEQVYREDLRIHPDNGWSYLGLAQALRGQGHEAEAAAAEREFHAAWSRADLTPTASHY